MNKIERALKKDLNAILSKHRSLQILYDSDKPIELFGKIKILDSKGFFYGSFEIRIPIPNKYPYHFPILFETSNKIPKIMDRHIESGRNCCVCIQQEQYIHEQKGISLYDFVEVFVVPFLAAQIYFEQYKRWPHGEYNHGNEGVLQYYLELFNTTDQKLLQEWVNLFLNRDLPERNDDCVCGEKKFKHCHLSSYEKLKMIGAERVKEDLRSINLLDNTK